MATRRGAEFAALIHQLLVLGKVRSVEDVARDMGMEYHTLYARIGRDTPFSADEIKALIRVVGDIRILKYFTDDSPYVVVERSIPGEVAEHDDLHKGLVAEAHKTVFEAADILETIATALADSKIDHRDGLLIRQEVDHCERALAAIRRLLDVKEGKVPA